MFPFAAAAGGGGGFSQSGSADTGPVSGDFGSHFGGIQTGGGLDTLQIALIAGVVLLALFILKK